MKGEYRIQAECPSCRKKISVFASTTDGKCPECGRAVPVLQMFSGSREKQKTTVNLVRQPVKEEKPPEKMKRYEMKPGTIVISKLFHNQLFIIMKEKKSKGSKAFSCLPVIDESARTDTDRFVNKLEEGKLVVFNKEERLFDYNIKKPVRQVSGKTFERLRLSYERFLSSEEKEEIRERHNVAPHDGFRNGNAWEGLVFVPGRIKVFRG